MKTKNIIPIFLIFSFMTSCAPTAKVVPTETAIPTSSQTNTPAPTLTATVTQTPISYIDGLDNIPEPDSGFVSHVVSENYLKVMGLTHDNVELVYAERTGVNSQKFVAMIDNATGVPLAVYKGSWQKSTLKFWGEQNGIIMGTDTYEHIVIIPIEIEVMSEFDRGTIEMGNVWIDNEPSQGNYNLSERIRVKECWHN